MLNWGSLRRIRNLGKLADFLAFPLYFLSLCFFLLSPEPCTNTNRLVDMHIHVRSTFHRYTCTDRVDQCDRSRDHESPFHLNFILTSIYFLDLNSTACHGGICLNLPFPPISSTSWLE